MTKLRLTLLCTALLATFGLAEAAETTAAASAAAPTSAQQAKDASAPTEQTVVALPAVRSLVGAPTDTWPAWKQFRQSALEGGRVIDRSDERLITTSEGQSYGMFFALVANDRASFDAIWQWTIANLCAGDCGKTRMAWLWGASESVKAAKTPPKWGVLDSNNATDADLWIAYSLLEAADRWENPRYREDALALLGRVKQDVRVVRGLGAVLLPANVGFEKNGDVVLNPSYYPLSVLKRLEAVDPLWREVRWGSMRALVRSAESGLSPDWVAFGERWGTRNRDEGSEGSWNAIRVYLWAGMMPQDDPDAIRLREILSPMVDITKRRFMTPVSTDTAAFTVSEQGPFAFGACLLPWVKNERVGAWIRTGLTTMPLTGEDYYRSVLALFGMGFDEARFAFSREGRLVLKGD
mgnify:CR=1 FL=1